MFFSKGTLFCPTLSPSGTSLSGQGSAFQLSSHLGVMFLSSPTGPYCMPHTQIYSSDSQMIILLSCPQYKQHIQELLIQAEPGGPGWDSDAKSNTDEEV